eukprot:g169.t1
MEWQDDDDEFEDDLDGLNDETFGDMDDNFTLGALPQFFGDSVAGSKPPSRKGAAQLLSQAELSRMEHTIKSRGGKNDDKDEDESIDMSMGKSLLPQDLLSTPASGMDNMKSSDKKNDADASVKKSTSAGDISVAELEAELMRSTTKKNRGPTATHSRPPPPNMAMPPRPMGGPIMLPPPPPGYMYVHPPPPGWRPGMPIPLVPINPNVPRHPMHNIRPNGPPRPRSGEISGPPRASHPNVSASQFPSLAEAAKLPKGARTEPRPNMRSNNNVRGYAGRSDARPSHKGSNPNRNRAPRSMERRNRPVRMHLRDIDFVMKIQMRALDAITSEDDFYFKRWIDQRRNPSPVFSGVVATSNTTKVQGSGPLTKLSGGNKQGTKKSGSRTPKQTQSEEMRSRATKSRAWAQTQKTLGFTSKSTVKAPRKMFDFGDKENEAKKSGSSSCFSAPFWKTRIGIESAISVILRLEEEFRRGPTASANVLGGLRDQLFVALELPKSESDVGDEWPAPASHVWNGAQFLRSAKGKKLMLRGFGHLDVRQRSVFLWVASRNLPLLLFSEQKDREFLTLNDAISKMLAAAFSSDVATLAVLTACLRQVSSRTVYDNPLLFYLLQNSASASVLEALLGRGEKIAAKEGNSGDARAWQHALAALQSRAVEASQSQSQ